MNKRSKRFQAIIKGRCKEYAFADVVNFLEFYGFKHERNGSSHFIFRRNPFPHITLVSHGRKIKGVYVRRAVHLLRAYAILIK